MTSSTVPAWGAAPTPTSRPGSSADTQKPNTDGKQQANSSAPGTANATSAGVGGKPGMPTMMNGVTTPTSAAPSGAAGAGAGTGTAAGAAKPGSSKPRVEVEGIYNSLREALGDNWSTYTEAVRSFFRGLTNRQELGTVIDPLLIKPELQRLHNQLFLAVELNATRDAPDTEVAQWVSHQGKSNTAPKAATGDAQERRLKREVMSLPARDRRRIKEIPEHNDEMNNMLQHQYMAKQLRSQDLSAPPTSAGLNKNWQTELTTAYSAPLAVESGEYMDTESIMSRCTPICYDEGLSSVITEDTARFIGLATDFFVREVVTNLISRIRLDDGARVITNSNVPHSKLNEATVSEKLGGTINMEHVRLSMTLGDNLVRQLPLHMYGINSGTNVWDRPEELEEFYVDGMELDGNEERRKKMKLNLDGGDALQIPSSGGGDGDDDSEEEEVQWKNPASIFLLECLAGH